MPALSQSPVPRRPAPLPGAAHDLYRAFGANRRIVTRALMGLGFLLIPILILLLLWVIDNSGTFSRPKE